MNVVRRILGIAFAVLFVLSAVVALALFTFDRKAFSAETYQRVFANQGFYDRIPAVLAAAVNGASLKPQELPLVMRAMDEPTWEVFFRAMLPDAALKTMGDQALDSTFAYVNLQTNTAVLSLAPLREMMNGDDGVNAVYSLLETQPRCTLVQVAQMTINLLTVQDIQFCNPPAQMHVLLTPVIHAQLEVTAFAVPNQVTLASAEGVAPDKDPRVRLQKARQVMRLTPIIPLAFLLLLSLLTVNSFRSLLDWWGIPFFVTGALAAVVALTGARVIGGLLRRSITQGAPSVLPAAFADYARELAAAMVGTLTRPMMIDGLILALFGLAMIAAAYFLRRRERSMPPSEQPTIVE